MKRLIPIVLLLLLLAGCGSEKDYLSIRPHVEQPTQSSQAPETDPIPEVTNRLELRGAILSLIDTWKEQGTLLIRDYEGDVSQNLSEVMDYATRQHPTGAYAVDYADAEIVEEEGQQLVKVSFVFRRSMSEINSIILVDNNAAAFDKIKNALQNYSTALTLRIRRYSSEDLETAIIDYCMENPRLVATIPTFSLKLYPEEGDHRIMELHFTYAESKDIMREKTEELKTTLQSALSYCGAGNSPQDRAMRACQYLISRQNQTLTDTVPSMPVYSLLGENIGHDLSYAMCYHDLCTSLGIRSYIVKGARGDQPYYWNLLKFGDDTYHVDLRRYVEEGATAMIPYYDEDLLAEGYVWDREAYPAAPSDSTDPTAVPTETLTDPATAPTEVTETTQTIPDSATTPTEVTQTAGTDPTQ